MTKFLQRILEPAGNAALDRFEKLRARIEARRQAVNAIQGRVVSLEKATEAALIKLLENMSIESFQVYESAVTAHRTADRAFLKSFSAINCLDDLVKSDEARTILLNALNVILSRLQKEGNSVSEKIRKDLDSAGLDGVANHQLSEIQEKISRINTAITHVTNQSNDGFWNYEGVVRSL